ncbi:MAG: hypothetical protein KFH87_06020 [Bacteroidetes bacterium]|nr:hypothetical protein [Bacteroidota bacterium]
MMATADQFDAAAQQAHLILSPGTRETLYRHLAHLWSCCATMQQAGALQNPGADELHVRTAVSVVLSPTGSEPSRPERGSVRESAGSEEILHAAPGHVGRLFRMPPVF